MGSRLKKHWINGVIWSVAPESMTQELVKAVLEAFNPKEKGNSPEYAKEQVPEGLSSFSRLQISDPFNLFLVEATRLL